MQPNNEYVVCGLAQDNDNVMINELNASYVDVISAYQDHLAAQEVAA